MRINIEVDDSTRSSEYLALALFFKQLGDSEAAPYGAGFIANPAIEEATAAVEYAALTGVVIAEAAAAPATTVKRTRRTKAEIEAAAAAAVEPEPAAVAVEPAAVAVEPAPTAVVEVIDAKTGEITQVAEEFETVVPPAGGKTYTEAEVQQLASMVARTKGPQIVKDKIAELGAARIAALSADQLSSLGAFLETQK